MVVVVAVAVMIPLVRIILVSLFNCISTFVGD